MLEHLVLHFKLEVCSFFSFLTSNKRYMLSCCSAGPWEMSKETIRSFLFYGMKIKYSSFSAGFLNSCENDLILNGCSNRCLFADIPLVSCSAPSCSVSWVVYVHHVPTHQYIALLERPLGLFSATATLPTFAVSFGLLSPRWDPTCVVWSRDASVRLTVPQPVIRRSS